MTPEVCTWAAARHRTWRTTAQLAKHHIKGSEIPDGQYSIYIQASQWLTSPKGYGVCVTERQAGNPASTVHQLCSRIVHLLYTGIQTYSAAVATPLTPKSNWKREGKKRERKISLFITRELLSNSKRDKHFSGSGSLQQSTSCRELFILFIQSVCT